MCNGRGVVREVRFLFRETWLDGKSIALADGLKYFLV